MTIATCNRQDYGLRSIRPLDVGATWMRDRKQTKEGDTRDHPVDALRNTVPSLWLFHPTPPPSVEVRSFVEEE